MRIFGLGAYRSLSAIVIVAQLSACASFDGMPKPVLSVDKAIALATTRTYSADMALAKAESAASNEDKRRYRDAFIAIHLQAADARYMQFRTDLSSQMKGTNLGFELGILALSGAGAIAASQRAANLLSAGASGLAGSKSALNKEVYFEKTLPALIASMDARRLTAKTDILDKMRNRTIVDYTIQEAMIDLSAYQMSASLDGAIERVTTAASEEKATAQARYDAVIHTCTAEQGVGAIWGTMRKGIGNMPPTARADLDTMSGIVGSPVLPSFDAQRDALKTAIVQKYCSVAAANALLATFKLKTGVFP